MTTINEALSLAKAMEKDVPDPVIAERLVSLPIPPNTLSEEEIENLRKHLSRSGSIEPHPYLSAGHRVRVGSGPLKGLEGIILRTKDRCRIVVSIHLIMRSVAVEVDDGDLEFIS